MAHDFNSSRDWKICEFQASRDSIVRPVTKFKMTRLKGELVTKERFPPAMEPRHSPATSPSSAQQDCDAHFAGSDGAWGGRGAPRVK